MTSRWVSEAVLSSLSATRKPQPGLGGQGSWPRSQAFLFHFPDIIGGHEVLHKESESPHNDSFLRYNTLKCRRLGSFGTDRGRKGEKINLCLPHAVAGGGFVIKLYIQHRNLQDKLRSKRF